VRLSARSALASTDEPAGTPLGAELDAIRARGGADLVDLAEGNPTRVGLASLRGVGLAIGGPGADVYRPEPLGLRSAREAIAALYAERGALVDPDRVVVAASTSELYGWLFKLLCDPGDRVLVPRPSYPLLDFLAKLEGVELASYATRRDEGFALAAAEVDAALRGARAVVVVHPNNPTGRFVGRREADALAEVVLRQGASLVVDEVFLDWVHPEAAPDRRDTFAGERRCSTFVLSGLSKVACLPHLKLAWMVVAGPDDLAARAIERLELVADCYLSASTPVQVALPDLLAGRRAVHAELGERLLRNVAALDRALAAQGPASPVRRLRIEGGWYAIVEVPRTRSDLEWTLVAAREEGVIVSPGVWFEAEEGLLVLSLLPEEGRFARAVARLVPRLARP
jgi:aspartate/methionine/tyrosine aminotransferase